MGGGRMIAGVPHPYSGKVRQVRQRGGFLPFVSEAAPAVKPGAGPLGAKSGKGPARSGKTPAQRARVRTHVFLTLSRREKGLEIEAVGWVGQRLA